MKPYVFVGPTLPVATARRWLDAVYLPPAAHGDLYEVALSKPSAIGLIDGYFRTCPSVWHKEILWSLTNGIRVYGSASMGALRASELADYGMIGVGEIYGQYRSGALEDDDEVAVTHGPASVHFRPSSEAMVNIRATIDAAHAHGQIRQATKTCLEAIAKRLFYPCRSYDEILDHARREHVPEREIRAFRKWLTEGQVDLKASDAIEMLKAMRAGRTGRPEGSCKSFTLERTTFWKKVERRADSRASTLDSP